MPSHLLLSSSVICYSSLWQIVILYHSLVFLQPFLARGQINTTNGRGGTHLYWPIFPLFVYFHLDVKSSANRKGVGSEERSFNHVLKLLNHISVSTVSKSTFTHRVTMGAQAGHLKPFSSEFWSVSLIANMAPGTSSVQYTFWISYVAKSWIATGINMPKIWHVSCRALGHSESHKLCEFHIQPLDEKLPSVV